jgi:hypothetical protein
MTAAGTLKQKGEFDSVQSAQGPIEVYYPRAYFTPPNLRLSTDYGHQPVAEYIELVEQKNDHFTFRRKPTAIFPRDTHFVWQAEGVPIGVPAAVVPADPAAPPPAVIVPTGGK